MSDDQQEDTRRVLYDKFVEDLAQRQHPFYDEDDLVELYDYAGDIGDRRVALEVLMAAARLYPDSVAMAERKAIFYMTYDEDGAKRAIADLPDDNIIGRLLSLRLTAPDKQRATAELNGILAGASMLTDEEILQLSDTVADLGMVDWLKENKTKIAALTDYPQTLYYELMQLSQDSEPEQALSIMEELTMMEPFNIDFWLSEAQLQAVQLHKPDQALATLEYALAIDPDHPKALMLKAQCMCDLGYPVEQTTGVLDRIMEIDPDLEGPFLAKAVLLLDRDREGGVKLLSRFLKKHPGSQQALETLLHAANGTADAELIEQTLRNNYSKAYLPDFIDLAQRFSGDGLHGAAAQLLYAADKVFGLGEDSDFVLEELYRAGNYDMVIDVFRKQMAGAGYPSANRGLAAAIFFILSMVRKGKTERLGSSIDALVRTAPSAPYSGLEELLARDSMRRMLMQIKMYLETGLPLPESLLNPYHS